MKKNILIIISFFTMACLFGQAADVNKIPEPCLRMQKSYGLVLSGGGAKGAYEVGFYKALAEYGLTNRITAISGTSVGALNGALFSCAGSKKAERIWRNKVDQDSFMSPLDKGSNSMGEALNNVILKNEDDDNSFWGTVDKVAGFLGDSFLESMGDLIKRGWNFLTKNDHLEGYFDRTSLRELITNTISVDKINRSGKKVYATAVRKNNVFKKIITSLADIDFTHYFCLNDQISDEHAGNILLASSAIPGVYESQLLDAFTVEGSGFVSEDYEYMDGGTRFAGGRNTPVMPVLNHKEIDVVFIVYLLSEGELDYTFTDDEYAVIVKSGKTFYELYPDVEMGSLFGGTIDFSPEKISYLIDLGYKDGMIGLSQLGYFKTKPIYEYYFGNSRIN